MGQKKSEKKATGEHEANVVTYLGPLPGKVGEAQRHGLGPVVPGGEDGGEDALGPGPLAHVALPRGAVAVDLGLRAEVVDPADAEVAGEVRGAGVGEEGGLRGAVEEAAADHAARGWWWRGAAVGVGGDGVGHGVAAGVAEVGEARDEVEGRGGQGNVGDSGSGGGSGGRHGALLCWVYCAGRGCVVYLVGL